MVAAVLGLLALGIFAPGKAEGDRLKPSAVSIETVTDKFAKTITRTFRMSLGAVKSSTPEAVSLRLVAAGVASDNGKQPPSPTDYAVLEVCVPVDVATSPFWQSESRALNWEMLVDGKTAVAFVYEKVRRERLERRDLPNDPVRMFVPTRLPSGAYSQLQFPGVAGPTETAWKNHVVDGAEAAFVENDLTVFGIAMPRAVMPELSRAREIEVKVTASWQPEATSGKVPPREEQIFTTFALLPRQAALLRDFAKTMERGK